MQPFLTGRWQLETEVVRVTSLNRSQLPNSPFLIPDGKVSKILKNSWSNHLSMTYNEKYNYGKLLLDFDD